MTEWVPFENGEYIVLDAFLMTPDHTAASIESAYIEVYTGPGGKRQVMGRGLMRAFSIVALHEEHETLDLLIDLGGRFKYRLKEPVLKSGKVFSPDVSSLVQFFPSRPWEQVSVDDFQALRSLVRFIAD